ncbi:hypothetical protein GPECTOR_114g317 [Gonium pectorale]|uniref:Uncharacterized protein n=1 Tax=Gonium pectorale TaxID=33097 RepID=A0A150FZ21_GONPE|nr:hypothetical protein GPECTOR_114g317 [Gonium pectorale]|eukprot:KXZ42866.1 hypothetical protein GPECTOR_114g317 [Gonium pectorale]
MANPGGAAAGTGSGALEALPDLPHVPHLFAQRIDALPAPVMEQVLVSLDRLDRAQSASASTAGRSGQWWSWLPFPSDARDGAGSGGGQQHPPSSSQVKELLRQRRSAELAADADSADMSDEPYDSIPRQVQLQWRAYTRMHPEHAATRSKLATLLTPLDGGNGGGGSGGGGGRGGGQATLQAVPRAGSAGALFGVLPSASQLQRSLQRLIEAAPPSAGTGAAGNAGNALSADAATAAAAALRAGGAAAEPLAAPARPAGAAGPGGAAQAAFRRDPEFRALSASLDRYQLMHWERLRPLAGASGAALVTGRRARMPAEWRRGMRPAVEPAAAARERRGGAGGGGGEGGGGVRGLPVAVLRGMGAALGWLVGCEGPPRPAQTILVPPEWL